MTPRKPKHLHKPDGRPTKYEERFNDMATNHCLLGATDESLARLFSVDVSTINKWKIDYPKFSESIRAGREGADEAIAKAMYHRAKGMTKVVERLDRNGNPVKCKEEVPPDPTCALFWLKNRHGKYWREKQEIDTNTNINISYVEATQSDAENTPS